VRVAVQTLAATLGGTQSLHTNGYDEALALPTAEAAKLALRTQQIVGYESGVASTADPLAGSYYVENLTSQLEESALELILRVDALGGSEKAIEAGFFQEDDRAQRVRASVAGRGRRDRDRGRQTALRTKASPRPSPLQTTRLWKKRR